MSRMVIAAGPRSTIRSRAASRIRRRVARACSARPVLSYDLGDIASCSAVLNTEAMEQMLTQTNAQLCAPLHRDHGDRRDADFERSSTPRPNREASRRAAGHPRPRPRGLLRHRAVAARRLRRPALGDPRRGRRRATSSWCTARCRAATPALRRLRRRRAASRGVPAHRQDGSPPPRRTGSASPTARSSSTGPTATTSAWPSSSAGSRRRPLYLRAHGAGQRRRPRRQA